MSQPAEYEIVSDGGHITERIVVKDRLFFLGFQEFVRQAASFFKQRDVLYSDFQGKKFLITYGVNYFNHTSPDGNKLTLYRYVEEINCTEVGVYHEFIRYDPFYSDLLKYADSFNGKGNCKGITDYYDDHNPNPESPSAFDTKRTYPDSTVFIFVRKVPNEIDEQVVARIATKIQETGTGTINLIPIPGNAIESVAQT